MTATLALLLLGFGLAGWVVLDGATTGLGLAAWRHPDPRRLAGAWGPIFLAGEVWLVAVSGLVVAAFHHVEAALARGHYLPVAAALVGWLLRDLALWFGPLSRGQRGWLRLWTTGSLLAAAAVGVVAGGLGADAAGLTGTPRATLMGAGAALTVVVLAGHGRATARLLTGERPGVGAVGWVAGMLGVLVAGLLVAAPGLLAGASGPATLVPLLGIGGPAMLLVAWAQGWLVRSVLAVPVAWFDWNRAPPGQPRLA